MIKTITVIDNLRDFSQRQGNTQALVAGTESVSYQSLDELTNQLAHYLISQGIGKGSVIPIVMERSAEYVISTIAVMKTGAAYVPLAVDLPINRYRTAFAMVGATFCLCHAGHSVLLSATNTDTSLITLDYELLTSRASRYPVFKTSVNFAPDNIAYIIFTSGTTGIPKAVQVSHAALLARTQDLQARYQVTSNDRTTFTAGVAFDAALFDIWLALGGGATLYIPDEDTKLSARLYLKWLAENQISLSWLPTGLLEILLISYKNNPLELPHLRYMMTGGERLKVRPPKDFPCPVDNVYGPSETTIMATIGLVENESEANDMPHIGQAVEGVQLYIVDENLNPVVDGEIGELLIGGIGVSLGYLGQSELNQKHFIDDPFSKKERSKLYVTGDRCRMRSDGNIEYVGRSDDQIKVQGNRVELGEIERCLINMPMVDRAYVCTHAFSETGNLQVVSYVVAAPGYQLNESDLKQQLEQQLAGYLVPNHLYLLPEFPVTSNGKVDKSKLPKPDGRGNQMNASIDNSNKLSTIMECFRSVLRVEIDEDSHFFAKGGNSIGMLLLLEKIQAELGIMIPKSSFSEIATPKKLLAYLESQQDSTQKDWVSIEVDPELTTAASLPFSNNQRAIWFEAQRISMDKAYNFAAKLSFKGDLDVAALRNSLSWVQSRNRLANCIVKEINDEPVMLYRPNQPLVFEFLDLSSDESQHESLSVDDLVNEQINYHFDIYNELLYRFVLYKVSADEYVLLILEHHFIHDGWSFNLFLERIFDKYKLFSENAVLDEAQEPNAPIDYFDFVQTQQSWVSSEQADQQRRYWKKQLQGVRGDLNLPKININNQAEPEGAFKRVMLDRETWEACENYCRTNHLTTYSYFIAAFKLTLAKYSNQKEISLGSPMANRSWKNAADILGMFVNTVVLVNQVDQNLQWLEFVEQVKSTILQAQDNQELPFDEVVKTVSPERHSGSTPFFSIMVGFHDSPLGELTLPGVDTRLVEGLTSGNPKFEMTLAVVPRRGNEGAGDPVHIVWEYRKDLFAEAFIEEFINSFKAIFSQGLSDTPRPLKEFKLCSGAAPILTEEPCLPADYPMLPTLDALVSSWAKSPRDTHWAYQSESNSTNYQSLHEQSDLMANVIMQHKSTGYIGVAMGVSERTLIAMMAILKAGCVIVPIDLKLPEQRIDFIADDCGLDFILVDEAQGGIISGVKTKQHVFSKLTLQQTVRLTTPFSRPNKTAYVIYTSGSTGHPKGAEITHQAVVNLLQDIDSIKPLESSTNGMLWTSLSFDISMYEIFSVLCFGGCIKVLPESYKTDAHLLFDWLCDQQIASAWIPPFFLKYFDQWLTSDKANRLSLQRLLVGIEPVSENLLRSIQARIPNLQIINSYGPTETTICSTLYPVPQAEVDAIDRITPIGKALSNSHLLVLDDYGNLCPDNVVGELYIGGIGVGNRYVNNPTLTQQQFVINPLSQDPRDIVYRTGDMVRRAEDGNLFFVGRNDNQVKIRGFRIELAEVEIALQQYPEMSQVAVFAQTTESGGRLVACYVADQEFEYSELSRFLSERLPSYMVPEQYQRLAEIPTTLSGKFDRKKLPELIAATKQLQRPDVAPENEMEESMVKLFCQVLEILSMSVDEQFFSKGGHSLMALKLKALIFKDIGAYVDVRDIMNNQTPRALANLLIERNKQIPEDEEEEVFTF
ncbi:MULTISPECIES: non-ribosomal peptide synthetase [unclassified Pseudoalteromonas]|uniref:non-ribosomal peptide synthetase n=1 Tax=unclassified Pseudoalteromonas TaxID=194690 RepID=UPI0025B33ECA|nr:MULTISPECIES: non-ribosomal peptide synthetase [unclassified Pseudoalteromonas]MDN3379153.1 amino acid adenylation domain-containing protein [Pseudoalteromonas sp. APC 3893]MDN3387648.1 amino acid adenylation domain-containing protein [Pseudoalteromonas sp. APC 4017]